MDIEYVRINGEKLEDVKFESGTGLMLNNGDDTHGFHPTPLVLMVPQMYLPQIETWASESAVHVEFLSAWAPPLKINDQNAKLSYVDEGDKGLRISLCYGKRP